MLDGGRAGGDDRERRAHGRHAGRPAVAERRGGARSRAGRSCKATEADLGPKAVDAEQKWLLAGAGREARAARPQERQGLLRLSAERARSGCGRASPTCSRRSSIPTRIDIQELKHRLLCVQALEAARCVEEGVITDVREADVGSILGFGFAPFTGGTLSYIDMMGTKRFVELCQRLEKKYGARFKPPKLLLDMAQKGDTFYGRFAPGAAAGGGRKQLDHSVPPKPHGVATSRRMAASRGRMGRDARMGSTRGWPSAAGYSTTISAITGR